MSGDPRIKTATGRPDKSGQGVSTDSSASGGAMGALMREVDWSATPLGPMSDWPHSLQVVIRILLTSRYAMWLGWGDELTFFYNDAYRPTLGVKHPSALGKSAREVWAEIWPEVGPRAQAVVRDGIATWDEALLLFLERSGYPEETYHTFSYSPIPDDDGGVGGMLCVVTEETERVIGERRLASLRELASGIASTNTEAELTATVETVLARFSKDLPFALLYMLEPGGARARLVSASGIAADHAGAPPIIDVEGGVWPAGELLARAVAVTVDDLAARVGDLPTGAWDKPARQAVLVPIAQQGQTRPAGFLVAGVNPYRRLDATYVGYLELVAGQIASGLANVRAYEEERRRAEALAELDRAKTTFFSNVSHEFRTPLTLMLGPTEDLLAGAHGPLDPNLREQLTLVHRNELRLQRLVNALLDFSRIEAGRIQACYVPLDLTKLTRDLSSTFRSAIERAGLTFGVDCGTLEEPVFVDKEMWEKIVLNLLSNALKFTFEGKIDVSVRQEGNCAVLRVSDTGVGIAEADLPLVFARFQRIEGTRARTHEGSGIGLALVQELAKLHGGSVTVKSRVGEGTTFTVLIPLGSAHLPSDRIARPQALPSPPLGAAPFVEEAMRWMPAHVAGAGVVPAAATPTAAIASGTVAAPARILLADDNADMRDYVRRLLERDWTVETAQDGERALAAALERPPDVIITDVMMPGLDGFGLIRALRADERTSAIPVVMLSARAGEEAVVEGLASGADDYLTKPFSARELLARVSSQLELSRLRKQVQAKQAELFSVLMNAPVVIAVVRGPELIFEMANDLYRRVVGGRDVVGKRLLDALPELAGQGVDELLRGAMRTGQAVTGNERHIRLDRAGSGSAEDTYWNFAYSPLRGADGELRAIIVGHDVTDQVVARRMTQESERRFRAIVEQVDAGIAEVDLSGKFTFVNDRFRQIVGRSREELMHSTVQDITHPDDLAATTAGLTRVIELGSPFAIEKRYLRPDGSLVWVQKSYARLEDGSGHPRGVGLVAIDTTRRKYAERALEESEAEAHTLLRISEALGASQTDLETLVQRVTDEATSVTGANFGAFFYNVTRPDGESYVLYTLSGAPKEAFAQFGLPRNTPIFGPTFRGEGIVRLDDVKKDPRYGQVAPHYGMPKGHLPVTSYLAVPVVARSGAVIGGLFFGHPEAGRFTVAHERIVRAIAASAAVAIENAQLLRSTREAEEAQARRARQAIFASEVAAAFTQGGNVDATLERCCALAAKNLEVAFAGVWIADAAGAAFDLRASAGDSLVASGAPRRVRPGQWEVGVVAQERSPRVKNELAGDSASSDLDWARRAAFTSFAGYPLVVEEKVIGVFGMFARRPFAEDTFTALEPVARTMAIGIERDRADEDRIRLLKELQRAVQFSETFVGILGHDLRSPLGAISTAAELLLRRETNERVTRPIERIRTSASRMERMIEQILDFTRARIGGGIPVKPSAVDLQRLAGQIVEELEGGASQKIVVESAGVLTGAWDNDRLAQVLSNLLGNAIEHGAAGAPVTVRLDGTEQPVVRISVINAGVIPAETLPTIFDPFRRAAQSTRARKSQGLGLGLYIVQQIVQAHGGRIEAQSNESAGTVMSVELPRSSHLNA